MRRRRCKRMRGRKIKEIGGRECQTNFQNPKKMTASIVIYNKLEWVALYVVQHDKLGIKPQMRSIRPFVSITLLERFFEELVVTQPFQRYESTQR
jgi:hypothetical protein